MTFRLREARITYTTQRIVVEELTGRQIGAPRDAAALLAQVVTPDGSQLVDEGVEHFGVLLLNTKHRVLSVAFLTKGTQDGTIVHPREVFLAAFLGGAAALIIFHNHPSGDPAPSVEDRALTSRLQRAGVLLGIDVLDSVIVGDGYWSFKEQGEL